MTARPRLRRLRNLAVVVLVGVAVGIGGYLGYQVATAPTPRSAPGWQLLAEMPNPRGETATAVAGGSVFVAGGYIGLGFETSALVSVYNAATDAWSSGPALPEARNHAAAAALDGVVYVSGGNAPSGEVTDTLWALTDGSWREAAPLPARRSAHRMAALGGRLYIMGGVGGPANGEGDPGRVLLFDPVADAWSAGAPMPLNRDHLAVVVVNDEIWAIGGRAGGQNYARVDIYDPQTDTWRAGPALPEATSGSAEAIVDGVVYLSGGEDPARGEIVDRHWWLDTALEGGATWQPLPPPPLAVHGVPGVALDGRFLVIAGSTRPGGQSNTAWTGATQAFEPAR